MGSDSREGGLACQWRRRRREGATWGERRWVLVTQIGFLACRSRRIPFSEATPGP